MPIRKRQVALPQLPLKILQDIHVIDDWTRQEIPKCVKGTDGVVVDTDRIIRLVRSSAESILLFYFQHYITRPDRCLDWAALIRDEVVAMMVAISNTVLDERFSVTEVQNVFEDVAWRYGLFSQLQAPVKVRTMTLAQRRRKSIDDLISAVSRTGRELTRTQIWKLAGYAEATQFERFQRGDPRTTKKAIRIFNQFLSLDPKAFLERLDHKE